MHNRFSLLGSFTTASRSSDHARQHLTLAIMHKSVLSRPSLTVTGPLQVLYQLLWEPPSRIEEQRESVVCAGSAVCGGCVSESDEFEMFCVVMFGACVWARSCEVLLREMFGPVSRVRMSVCCVLVCLAVRGVHVWVRLLPAILVRLSNLCSARHHPHLPFRSCLSAPHSSALAHPRASALRPAA
eukprot:2581208-Rhodomonas_salina.1